MYTILYIDYNLLMYIYKDLLFIYNMKLIYPTLLQVANKVNWTGGEKTNITIPIEKTINPIHVEFERPKR